MNAVCDTITYSLTTQQSMALLNEKDIPFELIEVCVVIYVSYSNTFMHLCYNVFIPHDSCVCTLHCHGNSNYELGIISFS